MFRDQQLMLKGFSGGTGRKVTAFQKQLRAHRRVGPSCPQTSRAWPDMQAHFQPSPLAPSPQQKTHALLPRPGCPGFPLTANIEAGASQNATVPGVTHQVVP